jgi:hypothetical protein
MLVSWSLTLIPLLSFIVTGLCAGQTAVGAASVHPDWSDGGDTGARSLRLTIRAGKAAYALQEAEAGNVVILARFENTSSQNVLLAHPNVCLPHQLEEGQVVTRDDHKSALSVSITAPKGRKIRLRNNILRHFAPGNRFYLELAPGESAEILLGWFGPHFSIGQWDGIDEPIFSSPGSYLIKVEYQNALPKACLNEARGCRWVDAWMGEVSSNTITLQVE